MYITKETKWQLSCCCHDNSYAAGPVLITTKIPRFHLTQGSSTPNNLKGRVKTMWEPCLFRGRPPVPLKKVYKRRYLVLHGKRLEPRVSPWQQYSRCHFVSFVMYISGAKFEDHCSNISGDILDSVFFLFAFLICIIQNANISKAKNDIPKRKTPLFFTLKSLSNKEQLFLLLRHFKTHRV